MYMNARKKEYDRIRYALNREVRIDKTGIIPRKYKKFNPNDYEYTSVGGNVIIEPILIQKTYPNEIQIQLDYARINYTPEQYDNLIKMLG